MKWSTVDAIVIKIEVQGTTRTPPNEVVRKDVMVIKTEVNGTTHTPPNVVVHMDVTVIITRKKNYGLSNIP